MTRDEARKALDEAMAQRLDHMFQILADTFAGNPNAVESAKKHFSDGVGFSLEAYGFAAGVIDDKFKGQA